MLALALALGVAQAGLAQEEPQPTSRPETKKEAREKAARERREQQAQRRQEAAEQKKQDEAKAEQPPLVAAGTKITAELVTALDAGSAQVGQEVVARVTKDVKANGEKVIQKGDRLLGRITSVEAASTADAGSRLTVAFDRLAQGEAVTELHAVVTSVLSTPSQERALSDRLASEEPMMAPAPAPRSGGSSGSSSSSGGGLLGGATATVGSTLSSATSAAGSTAGNVGGAVDATSRTTLGSSTGLGVSTPVRAIRIQSDAQAENQTALGSALSTKQGNLRLESGTRLRLQTVAAVERPAEGGEEK
jgi:hypothetical protein